MYRHGENGFRKFRYVLLKFSGGSEKLEFGQLNFCCFGECEPVERSDNYLEYILLYFLLISDILHNLFALYDSLIVHNLKLVKDAVVV